MIFDSIEFLIEKAISFLLPRSLKVVTPEYIAVERLLAALIN